MTIDDQTPEPEEQEKESALPKFRPFVREDFIAEEPVKEPSRLGQFMRKLLRWAVGLLVVFALGVGAMWYARLQPEEAKNSQLRDTIQSLEDSIVSLQAEVDGLSPLVDENSDLQRQLEQAAVHVGILEVLVDVSSAQLALSDDDIVTAKASLAGTDSLLAAAAENLSSDHQGTVEEMRGRLTLVLEELEVDAFAATRDLEVLSNNLNALTRSLFRE
jgi:hypothetical protein